MIGLKVASFVVAPAVVALAAADAAAAAPAGGVPRAFGSTWRVGHDPALAAFALLICLLIVLVVASSLGPRIGRRRAFDRELSAFLARAAFEADLLRAAESPRPSEGPRGGAGPPDEPHRRVM